MNINDIHTGDMILSTGTHFGARFVKFWTGSIYNHVAIVIECPITKHKYIFETGDPSKTGIWIIGNNYSVTDNHLTHIQGLTNELDKFYCRKLLIKDPFTGELRRVENKDLSIYKVWEYISKHVTKSYDFNVFANWNEESWFSLFDTTFLSHILLEKDQWSCSELVYFFYNNFGILDKKNDIEIKKLYPRDFVTLHKFHLLNNFIFGPLELINNKSYI